MTTISTTTTPRCSRVLLSASNHGSLLSAEVDLVQVVTHLLRLVSAVVGVVVPQLTGPILAETLDISVGRDNTPAVYNASVRSVGVVHVFRVCVRARVFRLLTSSISVVCASVAQLKIGSLELGLCIKRWTIRDVRQKLSDGLGISAVRGSDLALRGDGLVGLGLLLVG